MAPASQSEVYVQEANEEQPLYVRLRGPTLINKEVKARLVQNDGRFLRALYEVAEQHSGVGLFALNL